jgi:hypothetical protein
MTPLERPVPAAVYLIADNLDAVLAAGEDLQRLSHDYEAAHQASAAVPTLATGGERRFVETVRGLEMAICARVLQIRDRSRELAKEDPRFKPMAVLFSSGTAPLWDAVADLGDSTNDDFQSGNDVVTYLRSRGMVDADAGCVNRFGSLAPNESFLIAERIELGGLMDLCATYLDRLEDFYDLFDDHNMTIDRTEPDDVDLDNDLAACIAAAKTAAKTGAGDAISPLANLAAGDQLQ